MTLAHNTAVGALLLDAANLFTSGAEPDSESAVRAAAAALGANSEVEADALAVARVPEHWAAVCKEAKEQGRETMGRVGKELKK